MIVVLFVGLLKTFFFMRVVMSFSYIVRMIVSVCLDLKVFLTFFLILMVMLSAIFDVIYATTAPEY